MGVERPGFALGVLLLLLSNLYFKNVSVIQIYDGKYVTYVPIIVIEYNYRKYIKDYDKNYPLKPENVKQAIDAVKPFGIDVCSGVRTDGKLDEKKLEMFVNNIL